jgi:hypothetical protein
MQQVRCSKHKARDSKCNAASATQSSKHNTKQQAQHTVARAACSRRQWGSMLSKMTEDAVAKQVITAREPWQK